jgi:8-oxo-dGTP pyrophosphatase MutT (NUDIX family)
MTTATPPLREAARAIVLDAEDRVLLLRYDENGGFWATPGGVAGHVIPQGHGHVIPQVAACREAVWLGI